MHGGQGTEMSEPGPGTMDELEEYHQQQLARAEYAAAYAAAERHPRRVRRFLLWLLPARKVRLHR